MDRLKFGADGSLEIDIQRNDPGGAKSSNGLALSMRPYLPKTQVLDGLYTMPALATG